MRQTKLVGCSSILPLFQSSFAYNFNTNASTHVIFGTNLLQYKCYTMIVLSGKEWTSFLYTGMAENEMSDTFLSS